MTTKEIKSELKSFGVNIGQTRVAYKDMMMARNEGLHRSEQTYCNVVVSGVIVTKERGMDMWFVDFTNTLSNDCSYNDLCNNTKSFNNYLVSKGYNTEYFNGSQITING